MTPEPVAWVSRSIGSRCILKKRRNTGSCNNGLSSRTRPRTEMPTTPGVTRLTTGAMLCSGAPPTSGIGAPARDEYGAPFTRASPPDTPSAAKTRFIVVSTLGVTHVHSGRTAPSSISFSRSLSNPSRDRFKGSADRGGSSPADPLLTYCSYLFFCCIGSQFPPMLVVRKENRREHEHERPEARVSRTSADDRGDHLPPSRSSRPVAEFHLATARCPPGLSRAAPVSRVLEPQYRGEAPFREDWPGSICRTAEVPPLLMPTTACWCRRCGKTPWGSAQPDTTFPARGAA